MAVAAPPPMSSSYQVPGGTSGPMTPGQLAEFQGQQQPGAFTQGYTGAMEQPAPPPPPPSPYQQYINAINGAYGSGPGDIMTPAMQKYVDQFKMSQASQQQAINAGLLNAMQGLGQRRDAAAKTVATLTPAIASTYGSELQANKQSQAGAAATDAGAVQGAGVYNQAINNNAGIEKAAGDNSTAAMQAGVTADYSQGATALSNEKMQNQVALAQQQSAFDHDLAMAQLQYGESQSSAKQAALADAAKLQYGNTLDIAKFKAENPNAQLTPAQQQAAQNQQAIDAKYINAGFNGGQAEYNNFVNTPYYHDALNIVQQLLNGKTPKTNNGVTLKNFNDFSRFYAQAPQVMQALQLNPVWSQVSAVIGQQPPKPFGG